MSTSKKPSIRFTLTKALHNRTVKVIDAIDAAEDPTECRDDLAAIIIELNEKGMDFFFMQPLMKLKMGVVVERTAQVGFNGVTAVMGPTVRGVVRRMDAKQIRKVSKIIRGMMD